MPKKSFKILIEQDANGYFVASVPSLPGCYTQAKDLATLRERIKEAIFLCLEVAKEDRGYKRRVRANLEAPTFVGLDLVEV